LRRLDVRGNRLGPAGAEAVAGSERLASLHRLGLSGNDVGLPRLLSLPRAYNMLRVPVLDLAGNELTATGLQAILHGSVNPESVRLIELDLSFNQLGDDGARVLAKCPHLSKLMVLKLASCGIGDEGARALANSPHLNEVAELNVENNPIGDPGFRPWLESTHWRSLRRLAPPRIGISPYMRDALNAYINRPRRG
jgi:hypothetical protein